MLCIKIYQYFNYERHIVKRSDCAGQYKVLEPLSVVFRCFLNQFIPVKPKSRFIMFKIF
jgi:hypothetical protein